MSDVQAYKFDVAMACSGCSNALMKVLDRFKASNPDTVKDVKVDLDSKLVDVVVKKDSFSDTEIVQTVAKPGKTINWGEKDGERLWKDNKAIKKLLGQEE